MVSARVSTRGMVSVGGRTSGRVRIRFRGRVRARDSISATIMVCVKKMH